MDYEKKYKELVGEIRKAYLYAQTDSTKAVLEDIFPGLAESKGEKVREELIKHLKEGAEGYEPAGGSSDYQRWLAWLEKQESVDEIVSRCKNSWYNEGKIAGMAEGLTNDEKYQQGWHDALEKQGELAKGEDYGIDGLWHAQRILENTFGKVDGYQTDDGILSHECAISAVKELYEKKPAWSEEDEHRIKDTVYFLDTAKKHYASTEELDACIDWLNSLKNRVSPQSEQEWSEEDEQHIDSLLKRLDALCRNKFERTRFAISEDRDWIKSLRPQNRWKPSDEQIAQLQIVIDTYGNEGIYDSILTELLFQLKKLKGKV